MAPRRYRKRTNQYLINNRIQTNCEENETVEQYFLDAVESIGAYSDMNTAIKEIKSLVKIISSKEEVFSLLDRIETIIESIVTNIDENVSLGIIRLRIAYVRSLLPTLPDNYAYTDISVSMLDLLEYITESFDLKTVRKNIIYIQERMTIDNDEDNNLHSTILSILSNIEDGASHYVVNERIEYLQRLISKIS